MNIKKIIAGGLSGVRGAYFEDVVLKKIISFSKPGDKIGSQIILDFFVLNDEEFIIYEVKNYKNIKNGIKKAKKSYDAFNIQEDSNLKIIVSKESEDTEAIFLDPETKDRDVKNKSLKIVTANDVQDVSELLVGFMRSSHYTKPIEDFIQKYNESKLKEIICRFVKDKKGEISYFAIDIKELVDIYLNKLKNRNEKIIANIKEESELSSREIGLKLIKEMFDRNSVVQDELERNKNEN